MIKRMKYLLIFALVFSGGLLYAQDIHFSQFMHNPLHQNPGNTGFHNGDYRFNAAFRDQWRSVTLPYNTFLLSGDAANIYKNLSIGLVFMHDVAGDGRFRTLDLMPSASLNFYLDQNKVHSIRPGIQLGLNYRELRSDQFSWDSQFGGHVYDPSLPTNENFQRQSKGNFTVNSGLVYQWNQGARRNFNIGFSAFNLNRQNQGFFNETVQRPIRLMVHGRAQFELNDRWDLMPAFSFNHQAQYNEFLLGTEFRYILKESRGENIALYIGAFTRFKDAAFVNIGVDYQNWWFGLSYDWNYSKLVPASRLRGGIELTAQYIFKSFKPKKVVHRICPVYI